jgi:valyl-tRNA synthetase
MTLLSYSPQAKRIALSIKRIEGYRNFANKLWNAARYVLMKLESSEAKATLEAPAPNALANRYVLSRLHRALVAADRGLEAYRLDEATQAFYHFVWDELCDWYLELSKPLLESGDPALVAETEATLAHVLEATLRALHPFMPFITEEIWQRVPKRFEGESVMLARYPEADVAGRLDEEAERKIEVVQNLVSAVRSIRAEHDQPRSKQVEVFYVAEPSAAREILSEKALIESLSGSTLHETQPETLDDAHRHFANAAVFSVPGVRGAVPDVIDVEKERTRLGRELKKLEKELEGLEKKLGNGSFIERAPAEVVQKSREDAVRLREQAKQLEGALARL